MINKASPNLFAAIIFTLSFCPKGNAAQDNEPMRYLIDGTQSNQPFQIRHDMNDGELIPEAACSVAFIEKSVGQPRTWSLYVIEYDDQTSAQIQTVCSLHRESNELNTRYSDMQASAAAPPETTKQKLQDILAQSQEKRQKANKQMMDLLHSKRKIKFFKLNSGEVMISFSGKKIFLALEVTDKGKYVNVWHQVFDSACKNEKWTLK